MPVWFYNCHNAIEAEFYTKSVEDNTLKYVMLNLKPGSDWGGEATGGREVTASIA